MSVIVKGMEMPESCAKCKLKHWMSAHPYCMVIQSYLNWNQYTTGEWVGIDERCPLGELPEKHGRLIDGDALHALYESRWHDLQVLNWDENPHAEDIQTGVNWCINTLHDDLPTIVEAEGDDG